LYPQNATYTSDLELCDTKVQSQWHLDLFCRAIRHKKQLGARGRTKFARIIFHLKLEY